MRVLCGLSVLSLLCAMGSAEQHVIVVGGGLAGLSAAVEAAKNDARVTLVEGEKDVGGNSAKASSGINGCRTKTQEHLGIKDTFDMFYGDTVTAGDHDNQPNLVDILVHDSAPSVQWLIDFGVDLMDINLCGGHTVPRTHWIPSPKEGKPMPVGITIIRAMKAQFKQLMDAEPERVKLLTGTRVTELTQDDNGKVTGVRVVSETEPSLTALEGVVVLTTGGYANDHQPDSLLKEFTPDLLQYPSTNGAFAIGSGVKLARAIGVKLIDMNRVQVHPTSFVDPKNPSEATKFLAAEALRGKGAVLLNQKGQRFANELGRRDHLSAKIQEHCEVEEAVGGHVAWMVMNKMAVDNFGWPAFNFYWKVKGFFQEAKDAKDLAKLTGMDWEEIMETLEDLEASYSDVSDDNFGKTVFPVNIAPNETLYVAKVTPAVHYTMGGIAIDSNGQAFAEATSAPMPGLFAAGEVTGGVHGRNRLAGNSLLECVVFGRIAGRSAAGLVGHQHHHHYHE